MLNNIRRWKSADRDKWHASINEIRAQFIYVAAMPYIVIGIFLGGITVTRPVTPNIPFLLALALLLLGIISIALSFRFVRAARHLIVWASTVILLAAMQLLPDLWLPFLVLPLLVVHAILVSGSALATASLIGGAAVILSASGIRAYPLLPFLVCLTVGMLTSWSVVHLLTTALRLSWETEQHTDHLLVEARERQGNLATVFKSLDLSTTLLEQANHKLELARRQSEEAHRLKEQFAANVSHELRTPLNLILGFSEMIYMSPQVYGDMEWSPTLRRDVYQIYKSSRHLLEMIDDILDLSRFELAGFTLNKEPTNVEELAKNAVEMMSGLFRDRPVSLAVDVEPGLPELVIDRTRIRQVILNLLSNARRYTDTGSVTLRVKRDSGDVLFSVTDTGPGIATDKVTHIFEEFYQADHSIRRQHHGAGLGLAISKHFVQAHEGRIWVESLEGQGSTFYFNLPIPDIGVPTLYPRENRSPQVNYHVTRPRVILLDPDPAVFTLISRHLTNCDIGQFDSAAALFASASAMANPPDLIIANISPTSSCDAAGNIADSLHFDALPDTPVVRCSLPSKAWLTRELSVAASLNKPVTASQLIATIEQIGNVREILVVDDDRGFCQLIERLLTATAKDYVVRHAYDGEEGLQSMRLKCPDLVLLDLIMPQMDGFELLTRKALDPAISKIPVILLSVTSAVEDALIHKGNHLSVDRPGGLKLVEVLDILTSLANMVNKRINTASSEVEAIKNS